jgi:hypothetical protein
LPSVLLVEETVVPVPQVTDKCYPIMMYRVHFASAGFEHVSVDGTSSSVSYSLNKMATI